MRVDPLTQCWLWTGTVNTGNGYGAGFYKGKRMLAHRAVYLELVGDPGDRDLHHICRNRRCVNPSHLKPIDRESHIRETFRPRSFRISEQVDRYSIEVIKRAYGADNQRFIADLESDLKGYFGSPFFEIISYIIHAELHNSLISNCEWQVRAGHDLSLEEIGLRAMEIRRLNDERVKAKNDLARLLGEAEEQRAYQLPAFSISNFTMALRPHGTKDKK